MKFLVVALIALLSASAHAKQVCTEVEEALSKSQIVNNPNGSVTVLNPFVSLGGNYYAINARNGASAVCAMLGKTALKSTSTAASESRIATYLADGTLLGLNDYGPGKVLTSVICN